MRLHVLESLGLTYPAYVERGSSQKSVFQLYFRLGRASSFFVAFLAVVHVGEIMFMARKLCDKNSIVRASFYVQHTLISLSHHFNIPLQFSVHVQLYPPKTNSTSRKSITPLASASSKIPNERSSAHCASTCSDGNRE